MLPLWVAMKRVMSATRPFRSRQWISRIAVRLFDLFIRVVNIHSVRGWQIEGGILGLGRTG
jgi:hypothetical protein